MSGRKQHDETLFCERCGISFLWSMEEQKAGAGQPPPNLCPGCRQLLPPPHRERGLVKFYNTRKRFGFLVRRNAPELFVHGSALAGVGRLAEGDLVEFGVVETERGPAADAVRLLERAAP